MHLISIWREVYSCFMNVQHAREGQVAGTGGKNRSLILGYPLQIGTPKTSVLTRPGEVAVSHPRHLLHSISASQLYKGSVAIRKHRVSSSTEVIIPSYSQPTASWSNQPFCPSHWPIVAVLPHYAIYLNRTPSHSDLCYNTAAGKALPPPPQPAPSPSKKSLKWSGVYCLLRFHSCAHRWGSALRSLMWRNCLSNQVPLHKHLYICLQLLFPIKAEE